MRRSIDSQRRIETLDKHLLHSENLKNYRKIKRQYLRDVLQERFDPKKLPPITMWQEERGAKIAERDALYREYYALKEEAKKIEQIKRSVAEILRTDAPERTPAKARSQGVEL